MLILSKEIARPKTFLNHLCYSQICSLVIHTYQLMILHICVFASLTVLTTLLRGLYITIPNPISLIYEFISPSHSYWPTYVFTLTDMLPKSI